MNAAELQEQAWAFEAEGKLEEAVKACREALRLMEEEDGPDSPDVANLLNDLAGIEFERQDFMAALALAERARAIEDALGDDLAGETAVRIRMKTLQLRGAVRRARGDYARAEMDLKQALTMAAAQFGDVSEEMVEARNNLAVLYKYWGRFDEGLRLYKEALDAVISLDGEDCPASTVIYHNIGGILHAQGDFAAAEEPGRKAWEISRRLRGEDDPQTMLDAAAYAAILDGLGRCDESERIYRQALAIFERALGAEHYEVAATLHNLAAVLATHGHHEEAEQYYRRALAIKEKLLGAESPDAALTRHNLGSLLDRTGRPCEALPLLQGAVAILEKRLPSAHPHLALARQSLRKVIQAL